MSAPRVILHVDMDAFYASIEQRDNPALRGKPVLVGGDPSGRGVVSAASYEARPYGCRSAMPMRRALELCPDATVVRGSMEHYSTVSKQVLAILESYTPLVEPLSIDEAFLDVTGSQRLFGSGAEIASEIKQRVRKELSLTASVGVAPVKFLAKLASDLGKPDGLVAVEAEQVRAFLDPLPLERLWGAGPATLRKLHALPARTFGDLRRYSFAELVSRVGQGAAEHFYPLVRGDDPRAVVPDRAAKSISHETTFAEDIAERETLRGVLLTLTEQVAARLRRKQLAGRHVVVKIRTPDFHTVTRRATLPATTDETGAVWQAARELFNSWAAEHSDAVRLIGVGVSGLRGQDSAQQLELFYPGDVGRGRSLDRAVDAIRARFGEAALRRAAAAPARRRGLTERAPDRDSK